MGGRCDSLEPIKTPSRAAAQVTSTRQNRDQESRHERARRPKLREVPNLPASIDAPPRSSLSLEQISPRQKKAADGATTDKTGANWVTSLLTPKLSRSGGKKKRLEWEGT